jgi:hypothetical protein
MSDTNTQVSRRAFLAAGGGLLALASGVIFWRSRAFSTRTRRPSSPPRSDSYVDHKGWMLTAADKKKVSENQAVSPAAQ